MPAVCLGKAAKSATEDDNCITCPLNVKLEAIKNNTHHKVGPLSCHLDTFLSSSKSKRIHKKDHYG